MKLSYHPLCPLFILVLLLAGSSVSAQVLRPFSIRYQTTSRGKIVLVSNNIITSKGTGIDHAALPPNCGTASSTNCKNDAFQGTNIDIDGDPATVNSSSAELVLPACNTVSFAGLYWGAGIAKNQGANGPDPMTFPNRNMVKFKAPGGAYNTLSASVFDSVNAVFQGYQAFVDVTALVQKGGGGSYTIADVKCDTNKVNSYGGWTMVVVVRDSLLPVRNLTVFDGITIVGATAPAVSSAQFNVSGFITPPTGPVNCLVGVVCYDGDRGANDFFRIKQNSNGVFTDQTSIGESAAATSKSNDAWNASITNLGTNVTTRMPAHANTYGYDADLFQLENSGKKYLRNNDNNFTIQIGSSNEGYVLGMVSTQIDAFSPELILQTTGSDINGGIYQLGDTLAVANMLYNAGSDTALNVQVREKLPPYFNYVANSIKIDGVAKTDAADGDEAEYNAATRTIVTRVGISATSAAGGKIRSNGADNFATSYLLAITNNCTLINGFTPLNLLRQNQVLFNGVSNTTPDSSVSRPVTADPCVAAPAPDTARLIAGCPAVPTSAARLLSLTNTIRDGQVTLHWSVREEGHMTAYRVEKGLTGGNFTSLESFKVSASAGIKTYSYTDVSDAFAGTRFYRIQGQEADGQWWSSPVMVVKAGKSLSEPILAPNPGTTSLNISKLTGGETVQIYNLQGQLLMEQLVPANTLVTTLATATLPAGVYLIRVQGQGETHHLRWTKE